MRKIKVLLAGVAIVCSDLAGYCSDLLSSCSAPDKRAVIVRVATAELDVREDLGPDDALRIREYKKVINSRFNYPVAWCAIFVSYVYTQSGFAHVVPNPGKEWVPAWSAKAKHVIYKRGFTNNQYPCPGDVVTFYYPKLGYEGHIGLVKQWPDVGDHFYTIEGNWNGGVRVVMRRKTDAYKIMRFVTDAPVVSYSPQDIAPTIERKKVVAYFYGSELRTAA